MESKVTGAELRPKKAPLPRKSNGNSHGGPPDKSIAGATLLGPMSSRRSPLKSGNANQLVLPKLDVPAQLAGLSLGDVSRDQLLEVLEANNEGGIKIAFSGKSNARRLARAVRPRVSRLVAKYGIGNQEDRARNMVVEGDNLQAMATLYKERGQVDLIVTDPPYNTGKDFRYNDRWDDDPNDPGLGEFVSEDDGARHTKWMRFMWPRLQVMRDMLRPAGVLAICIDGRELFRLGAMLDELFGEENRLAIINWQKTTSKNQATHVSITTEYVLVYAKSAEAAKTGETNRSALAESRFHNKDNDVLGDWKRGDLTGKGRSKAADYAVQSPFTGEFYHPGDRHWANKRAQMKIWLEEWDVEYEDFDLKDGRGLALALKGWGQASTKAKREDLLAKARRRATKRWEAGNWPHLYWGLDGQQKPVCKQRRALIKQGAVPTSFWVEDDEAPLKLDDVSWLRHMSGRSRDGIEELDRIVGKGHGFDTVKPLKLIKKIIQIWSPPDGLIVDPFAGSGTTGHGVLEMNQEFDSSRRFILIEQGRPENGDSYARTLLAERLRRVINGEWNGEPIAGGFSFLTLGKKVDAGVLLQMERDEMTDTVIASHFDATRRRGDHLIRMPETSKYRYLVAKNADGEGFFLVWEGADKNADFTESAYEVCAQEAAKAGLKNGTYHVYARLYRYQTDGVRFYQIPDRILADFGLDLRSEPFVEAEAEVA